MLIKKRLTTVEEIQIELQTPAYFKDKYNAFYVLSESGIIQVSDMLIYTNKPDSFLWEIKVSETIAMQPATEAEFLAAYATARANTEYFLPQTA